MNPVVDKEFANDAVSEKAVRFVQFNAQKSQFATIELQKQVETFTNAFLLLQEPKVVKGKPYGFPKWAKLCSTERQFRAAIVHSKGLRVFKLPQFTDQDVVTCLWEKVANQPTGSMGKCPFLGNWWKQWNMLIESRWK
jgi:hypothetical protein